VASFMRPDQVNSLEMVLIDEKVCGCCVYSVSFCYY
jgi:hypothetical protein